uniref:MHD domain-containing protein n=2 Tax=Rhizochromulina marina TaxID=1034831 RepID=A0A7S2SCM0_9STRA|mmetsp:Transcript_28250/g.82648  ORF Transcript_28250/g.82648 Transcript_28250/m.82648 type:complete len:414 (+) Transcript_28250:3-1244(+)
MMKMHWRGMTPRTVCDFFWDEVNKYPTREEVPPILTTSKYYIISVYRDGLFVVATTTQEMAPLLAIEFLLRIFDIFSDYFDGADEVSIKENFSTCYQLLEEMMDHGYPLTTEPNALKAMIQPPTVMGKLAELTMGKSGITEELPDGTISSMPWRKAGVKYAQNEIYLDIVEEVDAIVDRNGQVVSTEVTGVVQANSRLSGIPDLTLTFEDPEVIDDCSFHPCVRYTRFERDRVVSFVPPDGQFELMRYRVNTKAHVSAPIYCQSQVLYEDASSYGRVNITVGQRPTGSLIVPAKKGSLVVEEVCLTIPFPKVVKTTNLSVNYGAILYDEATKVAKWTIGKMPTSKTPQLSGTMVLQGQQKLEENPPIQLDWKVPTASISGIAISSLQLTNEKYRPYKGVRTIIRSGKYQVRTS